MADFEEHLDRLDELGVEVVAFSVDSEEDAAGTVERLDLEYPIGHGANLGEVVAKTGAYADREEGYLQPTSFILRDGRIANVTYSSGPLGRLRAEKVIALVEHVASED